MATSNFPGYMEIKVEEFDGDTMTGELNLSYDEIEKYFNLGDGRVFSRLPNDFPSGGGMRVEVVSVEDNTIGAVVVDQIVNIYMTGGSSKAFSMVSP